MTTAPQTEFAAPCRQAKAAIRNLHSQVLLLPNVQSMCDALPQVVMFLNKDRQIVFSNQKLLDLTGLSEQEECLGLRPGELFQCIHAQTAPSGCGTAEGCRVCGAVLAVLESQRKNKRVTRELRLTARINGELAASDFKVYAEPFAFDAQALTIVSLMDISDQKRRRVLERIFFHDILNTAGSLVNLAELLSETGGTEVSEYTRLVWLASKQLREEIWAQRHLMQAENDELNVNLATVHSMDCLKQVICLFKDFNKIHGLNIELSPDCEDIVHHSDSTLLLRVLINMVKNALEACTAGQTVTVGCCGQDGKVKYWVDNACFMPQEVRLQIFQRSFTTKGEGRGLGTYSIRLLTEKYLKGQVSFESSQATGTRFIVSFPLRPV